MNDNAINRKPYEPKYIVKFILSSIFGLGSFMIPLKILNKQTLVAFISSQLASLFGNVLPYIATGLVVFSTIMSVVCYILPKDEEKYEKIRKMFSVKPLYVVTKMVASVFAIMIVLNVDVPMITSKETGRTMLDLGISLITIAIALSYVLPFLTDCGIMEFFGILTQSLITPLFKVPSVASLDLITSWFGASNAEVIVCREKYHSGYYNKREKANIMSNFSLVSVSFCYVICNTARLSEHFTVTFLAACFISIVLAIIMPRIPPLNRIPETYYDKKKEVDMNIPKGWTKFSWGLYQGCERNKQFKVKDILKNGSNVMFGIWFDLIPVVIGWGTLGMIVIYYTPIFEWISYPIGMVLNAIGIESAFQVAPATLVGFIDMFIPTLLIVGIKSAKTRFIIMLLSLVQMIYLTEVGTVMLQADIGLNLPKLFLVFIERTLLAFPFVYAIATILF